MKQGRGFTLVELLLALSLLSMLLALAYGGLRASTRAAEKGQRVLEDSSRVRMAHQFLRKQLSQMLPLGFAETDEQGGRMVFSGSDRKIRFVAPMPGYLGFGGPHVLEISIVSGTDGQELILSHAPFQGFEESNLYQRDPILLVNNIHSAEFSFLGRDEFGLLTPWMNQWMTPETLPEAVTLDIEFVEDVYIGWPAMLATARIDPTALDDLLGDEKGTNNYSTAIQELINKRKPNQ
jgi:general secretion pathway protein J